MADIPSVELGRIALTKRQVMATEIALLRAADLLDRLYADGGIVYTKVPQPPGAAPQVPPPGPVPPGMPAGPPQPQPIGPPPVAPTNIPNPPPYGGQ
jgi:hypothetical protein